MSGHVLGERERALEDAFFARQDRELLARLRAADAAKAGPGMQDAGLAAQLGGAGVSAAMQAAVAFVPLVLVAWADGKLDAKERDAVLAGAKESGLDEHPEARPILEAWLAAPPPASLHDAWRAYIHALSATLPPAGRAALKHDVLGRARRVAEAAGAFLGIGGVSPAEAALLGRLDIDFDLG